jgi:hypothetical protein
MSTLTAPPPAAPAASRPPALVRTARTAGAWYLALGVTGMLGFLVIRPQIFDGESAAVTYRNLVENAGLAQFGVALELGIVITQAVLAVWFYKLFRAVSEVAAVGILVFGMANAVAIMASATFMGTALAVTNDNSLAGLDGPSAVQLLSTLSTSAWGAGAIFFGLWLIPMGWAVLGSGFAPRPLGYVLIVGAVGYVASAVVAFAMPDAPEALEAVLTFPATVGEFWMIAYLLIWGVRRTTRAAVAR